MADFSKNNLGKYLIAGAFVFLSLFNPFNIYSRENVKTSLRREDNLTEKIEDIKKCLIKYGKKRNNAYVLDSSFPSWGSKENLDFFVRWNSEGILLICSFTEGYDNYRYEIFDSGANGFDKQDSVSSLEGTLHEEVNFMKGEPYYYTNIYPEGRFFPYFKDESFGDLSHKADSIYNKVCDIVANSLKEGSKKL